MGDLSKYKIYRKYMTSDGVNYTPLDEYQAVVTDLVSRECSLDYDYVITYGKSSIEMRFIHKDGGTVYSSVSYLEEYDTNVYVYANMLNDDWIGIQFIGTNPKDIVYINWDKIFSMKSMFYNYKNPIDTTYFDTKNVTNMAYAFTQCSGLTSLDVSNFNTSNVTDMSGMFSGCTSLASLDVSNFNTSNVTNMSGMFDKCSKLTSVDLSNFDTFNVTDMSYMFRNCSGLTSLDVSNFNLSNVTNLYQTFYGCKNLTHLDLSNWELLNPGTNIGQMIEGCSNLDTVIFCKKTIDSLNSLSGWGFGSVKTIDFSKWDTSEMTTFASLCTNLKTINFIWGDNFNTSNITNISKMFSGCTNLTSLDLSGWDTSKVTNMSSTFRGCTNLTTLDISDWNTSNVTDMEDMFYACDSLTSLDLSNINASKVTNMSGMFYDCSGLTSLNLSNIDASNVTDMSYMFYHCSGLTSLDLSSIDTSKVTNVKYMFGYCSGLTSLDLSGWDLTNVTTYTNYSSMFSNCKSLQYIYVCGCNQATIDKINNVKPANAEIVFNPYVFNNEYVCDSELDVEQNGYKYEIWREVDCQDNSIYTGNVEYRNPQESCDCGWTGLTWVFNNEYINGSEIPSTISYITNYSNSTVLNASIDTGIKASTNLRMQIDYTLRDRSGGCLIGTGVDNYRYFNYDGNSGMFFDIASGGASGTQRIYKANSSTIGTRYNIEVGNYYIKNLNTNTYIVTGTPQNYSYDYNVRLFGLSTIDGSQFAADGVDVYSFKIYENEVLVRDYIPYKENGIIGMWDKVEGKFYAPEGGDNLIAVYDTSWDENSKYEIWRETQLCDVDNFTGNVEYRNPQPL